MLCPSLFSFPETACPAFATLRVALQAQEPSGHSGRDVTSAELHLAVSSTPGCPRWHSQKNSRGLPSSKQEQGMVSSMAEIPMLLKMWSWLKRMSDTSHEIAPPGIYREISPPKEKVPISPGTWLSEPGKAGAWAPWTHSKGAHHSSLHWQKPRVWQHQGLVFSSQLGPWELLCIPPQVWLCHCSVSLLGQPHHVLLGQSWALHPPRAEMESRVPKEQSDNSPMCHFKVPFKTLPHASEEIFFSEIPFPV